MTIDIKTFLMKYVEIIPILILILILILALIIVCSGCKTMSNMMYPDSVCYDIPAGQTSVICEAATELDIAPEAISGIVKIANIAAISANVYTARRATAFLDMLTDFVNVAKANGLTYAALISAAKHQYAQLPPKIQTSIIIINAFAKAPGPLQTKMLTDYDFKILLKGIDDQRQAIRPFLM